MPDESPPTKTRERIPTRSTTSIWLIYIVWVIIGVVLAGAVPALTIGVIVVGGIGLMTVVAITLTSTNDDRDSGKGRKVEVGALMALLGIAVIETIRHSRQTQAGQWRDGQPGGNWAVEQNYRAEQAMREARMRLGVPPDPSSQGNNFICPTCARWISVPPFPNGRCPLCD